MGGIFCVILGCRPLSAKLFGDTVNYARAFYNLQVVNIGDSDWIFSWIMYVCHEAMGDVSSFFTIIAFMYIFFALWGIHRLFQNNTYGAILFYIGAFSFFSYATNGIRNGLACAIFIAAISLFIIPKRHVFLAAILVLIAFFIHKSIALPIVCFVASLLVRDIKFAISFWILSIFLYFIAGTTLTSFFMNLGFDDRMTAYIQNIDLYAAEGYKTGFRFDFLLYSFMPILLGWYIIKHKRVVDNVYIIILNTYIFANSFWVIVMNASYSNRFAYLSWFLYPIVLAYPCLKMDIWGAKQGKYAGLMLLAHTGFTFFMHFIYY